MAKGKKEKIESLAQPNPFSKVDYGAMNSSDIQSILEGGLSVGELYRTGPTKYGNISTNDISEYGSLIQEPDNRITSNPDDWQDIAANNQGWATQTAKGVGRLVGSSILKTAQSLSLLGSGLVYGAGGAYETLTKEEKDRQDLFTLENITQNSFVNGLFQMEEDMKHSDALRIFKPNDWDDRSIWQQIFSGHGSAWLADEFTDGLAFMASSMAQAYMMGGLGSIGRGAGSVRSLPLAAAGQTTAEGAMGLSGMAKVLNNVRSGMSALPGKAGFIAQTGLLSANEALFEARDTGIQVQNKVLADLGYEDASMMDYDQQKEFIAGLSEEEQRQIKEKKASAMSNTFMGNMSLLMFSNAIELSAIQKMIGKTSKGLLGKRMPFGAEGNILDDVKDLSKTGKGFLARGSQGRAILGGLTKNAITEGLFEENLQNAIQNISQTFDGGNFFKYMGEVIGEAASNTVTNDKETWKSIVAGAAVGGPGGAIGGAKGWRSDKDRRAKVIESINGARDNFKNLLGGQLYERNEDGSLVIEDGEPVLNQDRLTEFMANVKEADDLSALQDAYQQAGNTEVARLLRTELMSKIALNYLEAGLGDELTKRIDALGAIPQEEYQNAGIEPEALRTEQEDYVALFKQVAENAKKDYAELSRVIPNAEENQMLLNTAVKTSTRLRSINDIAKKLDGEVTALRQSFGNPAINDINHKTLRIKELESNLKTIDPVENGETYSRIENMIRLEKERLAETKELASDNLFNNLLIKVPKTLSYIRQDSANVPEKEEMKRKTKKQVSAQIASIKLNEEFNKMVADQEAWRAKAMQIADDVSEENEKLAEKESLVRNLQDGEVIEVTNEDGTKQMISVSQNPQGTGLITDTGIPVNSSQMAEQYKEIRLVSQEEAQEFDENRKINVRNKQLRNRIAGLDKNIKTLRDKYFSLIVQRKADEETLSELQNKLNKTKSITSQKKFNRQIEKLEKTIDQSTKEINRLRNLVSDRYDFIEEIQQEIYDRTVDTGTEEMEKEVNELRDKVLELEIQIEDEKNFLQKLIDTYNVFKKMWQRFFPNKRRVFQNYQTAEQVIADLDQKFADGIITEEEYFGEAIEQDEALNDGRQYSDAKTEITNTKEEIDFQIAYLKELERHKEVLQRRLNAREKELREYQSFLNKINRKIAKPEAKGDNMPPTPAVGIKASVEGFKKDIQGGLFTTTGNSTNKTPGMNAWFKFTDMLTSNNINNYKLIAVTINHPVFGKGGKYDVYSQEAEEYQNENNIKVVAVNSTLRDGEIIPYMLDNHLISTSLVEYKEDGNYVLQDGSRMFTNKKELTPQELDAINNEYANFIKQVKNTKDGIVLDITDSSSGFIQYDPNQGPIPAREAFGYTPKLLVATNEGRNIKGVDYRTELGGAYVVYKGTAIPADVRNINDAEAEYLLEELKDYAGVRGTAQGAYTMNKIKGMIYMGIAPNNPDHTTYFVDGIESFVFGTNSISTQDLQDGKYDEEILEHLAKQRHQVDVNLLNQEKPYQSYSGKTYNTYQDYLTSNAEGRQDAPVKFKINKNRQGNENRQIDGRYLNFSSTGLSTIETLKSSDVSTSAEPTLSPVQGATSGTKKPFNLDFVREDDMAALQEQMTQAQKAQTSTPQTQEKPKEKTPYNPEEDDLFGGEPLVSPVVGAPAAPVDTTLPLADNPLNTETPASDDLGSLFAGLGPTRTDVPAADKNSGLSSLDRDDVNNLFLKASEVDNYKKGDIETEVAELERLVGKNALDKIVHGLINGIGYGMTTSDGRIILSNVLTEGTAYHEAFHRVFGNILTPAEYEHILNEWRKDNPTLAEGKDNNQIEEILAEEFREYMLSRQKPQGIVGRLFDRILEWFNSLFKIESSVLGIKAKNKLFSKIARERFKNAIPLRTRGDFKYQKQNALSGTISSQYGTATERQLFEGMSFQLMQKLVNEKFELGSVLQYANKELDDASTAQLDSTFFEVLKSAFTAIRKRHPNNERVTSFLQFVSENRGQIMADFKNYLKRFNITTREEVEGQTELTEETRAKDTLGILDSFEFDPKTGTSNTIKLIISSLPAMSMTNGQPQVSTNSLGLFTASDYRTNMSILFNHLSRTDGSLEQMRDELIKLSAKRPEFMVLANMLKLSHTGSVKSDSLTLAQHKLQTKFRETFDKSFYDFYTMKFNETDEGLDTFYVNSNNDRAESITRSRWSNSFSSVPAKAKKTVNGQEVFNKAYFDSISLSANNILDVAEDLGITFSNPNEINRDVLLESLPNIIAGVDGTSNLFSEEANVKGYLNRLIAEEIRTSLNQGDNQHINPEGKTVYSVSLHNALTLTARQINNNTADFLTWNETNKKGNPLTRNSAFLKAKSTLNNLKFKIVNLEGVNTDSDQASGDTVSRLSATDKVLFDIASTMAGKLPFLRQSDRKVEYGIELVNGNTTVSLRDLQLGQRDVATETFKGYLADELLSAYMLNVEGIGSDVTYYKDAGKDLRIFEGVFPKHLEDAYKRIINPQQVDGAVVNFNREKAIEAIDTFANREDVREVISQWMDTKVEKVIDTLLKNGIIEERKTESGTQIVNRLLPAKLLNITSTMDRNNFFNTISEFAFIDYISQVEQSKLFIGDPAFFKQKGSKVDFFKRTGGLGGTGKTLDNSADYLEAADRLSPRGDGRPHSAKMKTWVFNDVKATSSLYNKYVETLTKSFGYSKAKAEKLLKNYKNYDEADAQGYITIHGYRDMLQRSGQWLDAQEKIYQEKLRYNLPLTAEEILTFPPLKPQYYGPQTYGELYVPSFYKLSLMPLIPSVTQGSNIEELRQDMEANGVDTVTFLSGVKVGHRGNSELYGENGRYNKGPKTDIELDWGFMKIQLDMSPEKHESVTFGTQFRKLILSNIFNKTLYGSAERTKELVSKYNLLINNLTNLELSKLMDKFDVKRLSNGEVSINREKLSAVLLDDAFRTNAPKNVIDDINYILNQPGTFTEAMITRSRMEGLLMGMIDNKVIKTKVRGDMMVQGSVAGMEKGRRTKYASVEGVQETSWGSNLDTLGFYEYQGKDKPVKAMEVYLPHRFKELMGQDINISDIPKELRTIVGFRIPTQGLNSIEFIHIKGFLPQEAGNLVIVPSEIVAKAGSDFDIDKMTLFFPYYKVRRDWKSLKATFLNLNPSYRDYLKSRLDGLETLEDKVRGGEVLNMYEEQLYSDYKKFLRAYRNEFPAKLEYVQPDTQTFEGIQNNIIRTAIQIVSAPENFIELISPISAEMLENEGAELSKIIKDNKLAKNPKLKEEDLYVTSLQETPTKGRYFDFDYRQDTREAYLTGKDGVAIAALHLVHHSMSQQAGLALTGPNPLTGGTSAVSSIIRGKTNFNPTNVTEDKRNNYKNQILKEYGNLKSVVIPHTDTDVNGVQSFTYELELEKGRFRVNFEKGSIELLSPKTSNVLDIGILIGAGKLLEESSLTKENTSSTSFEVSTSAGYAPRTRKNASADATIALAVDFTTAGEKLTRRSVEEQQKKYISTNIPVTKGKLVPSQKTVDRIVDELNSVNAKTLNIAGNGIYTMLKHGYTQEDVDTLTFNLLSKVINSPKLNTKIESIRSGGQTGFDEAGIKAAQKLGIKSTVLAPKGWSFRNASGQDINNEQAFKERFGIVEGNQLDLFNSDNNSISYINLPYNVTDQGDINLAGATDVKGGNLISDVISAFLNGFVDIAKDPFLKAMNADTETANTYLYLIRAGVPIQHAVRFMNQPIILDYINRRRINNSISVKAGDTQAYNRNQLVEKVKQDWASSVQLEDSDYRQMMSVEGLNTMLAADNNNANLNAVQLRVLDDFLHYEQTAGKLSDLMRATNADTRGTGGSMYSAKDYLARNREVKQDIAFKNVNNFETNTFLNAFNHAIETSVEMYSPLFSLISSTEATAAIDYLKQDLGKFAKASDVEKLVRQAESEFITYIMQKAIVNGTTVGSRIGRLFKGADSVPKRIASLKANNSSLKNNLFIKELNVKLSTSVVDNQTADSYDFMTISSKKLPTEIANDITDGWQELIQHSDPEIRRLGNDLIDFALLQSAMKRSSVEFLKYAPTRVAGPKFNDYLQIGQTNNIKAQEFLDYFYRNNWRNPSLVKWISLKGKVEGGKTTFSRSARFLKTGSKAKGYKVWRNTYEQSGDFFIFEEVATKGVPNLFYQYTDDIRVVANTPVEVQNNTPQPVKKTRNQKVKEVVDAIYKSDKTPEQKQALILQAQRISNDEHVAAKQIADIYKQFC